MTDRIFVFDVDGTLTDPRRQIVPEFKNFMFDFVKQHTCMIVTGSDRPKTIEQIGEDLTNSFAKVYHCSGNHVYIGSEEVYKSEWKLSEAQQTFLQTILHTFNYPEMTGNHIEQRIGTANFSIVGRNANWDQRERYANWEKINKGRETVAMYYNEEFKDSVAQVAGQTSIDIYKTGCDKSQAIKEQKGTTIYFGDHCQIGGNDFTAAQASSLFYNIEHGYKETWKILKKEYKTG
tara:strand:+ start:187 stop:888 length:702 start_codon:yes stop_codon:yes gene_type:complete